MLIGYGISVGLSTVMYYNIAKVYESYIKEKGYELKKKNKTKAEKTLNAIQASAIFLFPVANVIIPLICIGIREKLFESMLESDINKGNVVSIKEVKQEETIKEEYIPREEKTEDATNQVKKYKDMSTSEKLEYLRRERELLDSEYLRVANEEIELKLK